MRTPFVCQEELSTQLINFAQFIELYFAVSENICRQFLNFTQFIELYFVVSENIKIKLEADFKFASHLAVISEGHSGRQSIFSTK